MSDYHASHEAGSWSLKLVIGAGLSFVGAITLDQWAILVGILCSLVVTGHTLWRWANEWRDRKARLRAEASRAPESWV